MKRFSKLQKISSLVLALVMTLSLALPYVKTVEAADDTTGWTVGSTSTVTGNATDGWKVSVSTSIFNGSAYGTFYSANIAVSNLQMNFDLSELVANKNLWLVFSNANGAPGAWSETKASFLLKRTSSGLEFCGHTGGAVVGTAATISGFDFDAQHVFEFLKDGDVWKPAIDGTTYEVDCTSLVNGMLKNSAGKTAVGFGAQGSDACIIKNITFSEKVATGWTMGTQSMVSGNATDGYTLSLAGSSWNTSDNSYYSFTSTNVADIRVLVDLSTMATNEEFCLSIGCDFSGSYSLTNWSANKLFFMLKRVDGGLKFYGHNYYGEISHSADTDNIITNFDFDKTHVLEFLPDEEGIWHPAIDGKIYKMDVATASTNQGGRTIATPDEFVTYIDTYLKQFVIGFMRNNSSACVINNVKFAPKADALGATIATQFEENVPIKMGFDYSIVKKYLTEETLVNYGAVLVSKEATAAEMQGALKTALTQGNSFDGITYSSDYKYMFTVGGGTTVPDEYYVTIKSSDNVEYMDRNISAIGYIVTQASDGTYKYYFTTNEDTSKNITNGAISKSVTELLKIACEQYLEIYDAAAEEDQKTLEDVVAAFNAENALADESAYSVDTLRTLIADELADVETDEGKLQREFLKYVHLGLRNGVPTVLSVADYGAVGDGTTDDTAAIAEVLAAAQETQKKTLIIM